MEFKIDTRSNYTLIRPLSARLDANMAVRLSEKCQELSDTDSQNYLVDLDACQEADEAAFEALANLHEACYAQGQSIVFTNIQDPVLEALKEAQMNDAINITPTEQEAVDIISMEILERDLFNEEG